MLPEGDILPDLPLRTLDLSAAHESSITSNDVFVDLCVYDTLLLYAAGSMKPSAFSHYRWIRAMVISIAIIPYYRKRKPKEDYQPLPCAVNQLASTEAHPRPQPPPRI